jgi:hypothetical protein
MKQQRGSIVNFIYYIEDHKRKIEEFTATVIRGNGKQVHMAVLLQIIAEIYLYANI